MYAEVIVDIATSEVDRIFDYDCGSLPVVRGVRVFVPFGNRFIEGFVINTKGNTFYPKEKIKTIKEIIDASPIITEEMFELMDYMTSKLHLLKVHSLRLFIPAAMRGGRVHELKRLYVRINEEYRSRDISTFIKTTSENQRSLFLYLRDEVQGEYLSVLKKNFSNSALNNLRERGILDVSEEEVSRVPSAAVVSNPNAIRNILTSAQNKVLDCVNGGCNDTFLLFGVTGSGKTEVYMNAIEKVLFEGKTAIMLVPEISLTPQFLKKFRDRFGESVALLHSGLSNGERYDEWRKCLNGEARVALGPRSAVFAPLTKIGIIIIDEEHDSSYISDSAPRYSTFDIAEFRAGYNGANLLLGSATPSVETFNKARTGKIKLLELPERINKRDLPLLSIVNMCKEWTAGNPSIISRALRSELDKCLDEGNQAMLFLNRRGYSSFIMCRQCGYVAKCEDCDVSLVYHKEENLLKCHYCGKSYTNISMCPECGSKVLRQGYIGTEQVVEILRGFYPSVPIERMDNDTVRKKDGHTKILEDFSSKKTRILVGTQMIAKGHDFPSVTLVGILDADMSLHVNDYRAVERTFQLCTQVAGRAGRAEKPGTVILQTYSPNHYIYEYIKNNDYKGFYEKEINLREVSKFPPFSTIIRVLVAGYDDKKAAGVLKNIYQKIEILKEENEEAFCYFSYMRSPLKKIQGQFRMQILIRLNGDRNMNSHLIDNIFDIVEEFREREIISYAEINPVKLA